jgi:hypothetical protein
MPYRSPRVRNSAARAKIVRAFKRPGCPHIYEVTMTSGQVLKFLACTFEEAREMAMNIGKQLDGRPTPKRINVVEFPTE